MTDENDISERYYTEPAAAFVRASLCLEGKEDAALIQTGLARGLRLHKFKRTSLARVEKVLGMLRGLAPESLLDIGSGRGAFLWPFLDAFGKEIEVTSVDILPQRVADILKVKEGGYANLNAQLMDAQTLGFPNRSFDVVCALEVLEHLSNPKKACSEILRVARRFAVLSMPSKPDDNPEHIHLFDDGRIRRMLEAEGAFSFRTEFVLNHRIVVVKVPPQKGRTS